MAVLKILRWLVIIGITVFVIKQLGKWGILSEDLWQGGAGKLNNFKKDSRQLLSGEAVNKVSQGVRSEMQEAQKANPAGDNEMSRELQQERARVMDAKFDALKNPNAIKQQAGSLSEQTTDSARKSGGGY